MLVCGSLTGSLSPRLTFTAVADIFLFTGDNDDNDDDGGDGDDDGGDGDDSDTALSVTDDDIDRLDGDEAFFFFIILRSVFDDNVIRLF